MYNKLFFLYKKTHLDKCRGISSLVGMVIIVAMSVAIGLGLYAYTSNIFSISTPRNIPVELTLTCYNISYDVNGSGILCFIYNNLDAVLPLRIYFENGYIMNYTLLPSTLNVIGCSKQSSITGWWECETIRSRILYVECVSCSDKVRISILYKDYRPDMVTSI